MTSPSAFLYRYTPGSVGIVRILASKSIHAAADASSARGESTILLDGNLAGCVTKRADEPSTRPVGAAFSLSIPDAWNRPASLAVRADARAEYVLRSAPISAADYQVAGR